MQQQETANDERKRKRDQKLYDLKQQLQQIDRSIAEADEDFRVGALGLGLAHGDDQLIAAQKAKSAQEQLTELNARRQQIADKIELLGDD